METKSMARTACGLMLATTSAGNVHAAVHIGPGCAYSRIQDAIDALAPGETDYRVARGTYRENLLFNSPFESHRLQVRGGYVGCTDEVVADPDATVIDASGTNRSAAAITGLVDVTFANLAITGGNAPQGGGILISGGGQLALDAVHLSANAAANGGGLFAIGSAGPLTVRIGEGTLISGNTANLRGGGVLLGGDARLLMNAPQSAIAYNTSLADDEDAGGGGLAIAGPARADIGSDGYFNAAANAWYGAISNNNAVRGGGVDVRAGGTLRIYSIDTQRPLAIHDNHALSKGGGVYAKDATSTVCAWNVALRANSANQGAAMQAESAHVSLSRDFVVDQCGPEAATTLGATECALGQPCNRIEGNSGSRSIVVATSSALLDADRVTMLNNTTQVGGGRLIDAIGEVSLQNCLVARNIAPYVAAWDGRLLLDGCTIADNGTTGVDEVFRAASTSSLEVTRSIVIGDEYVLEPRLPPASAFVADVLTSNAAQLSIGEHDHVFEADPVFVDAAAGDYHLGAGSPAIDVSSAGLTTDLDGHARGIAASPAGGSRRFDLGAFEADAGVPGDAIFRDTFERAAR